MEFEIFEKHTNRAVTFEEFLVKSGYHSSITDVVVTLTGECLLLHCSGEIYDVLPQEYGVRIKGE